MSLHPGDTFAGFRVEDVAGRGGTGVVYRARDLSLDRVVALKVIDGARLDDPAGPVRFMREARAAASIDHPAVVPVYAAGHHEGAAYLAMRFVPGRDLRRRVRDDGPLDPAEAARIVTEVAGALDAAHAGGVVHRDVKPANVLLEDGGRTYLTDFGIARAAGATAVTRSGEWIGTVDYVAPEQIRGDPVDGRADVYALGGVLVFALTGRAPFARDTDAARLWAHLHAAPPRPSTIRPGLPAALDAVVARALAKAPADRYPTAGAFARDVRSVLAGRPATAGTPRRRTRTIVAGLATVAAAAGALALASLALDRDGGERAVARATPVPTRDPPRARTAGSAPRRITTIDVGRHPFDVLPVGRGAWVASLGERRIARIGPDMRPLRHAPWVGAEPVDMALARDTVWVAVAGRRALVRLRASDGRPAGRPVRVDGEPRTLAVGRGDVWVGVWHTPGLDEVVRVDGSTGRELARVTVPEGVRDVHVDGGSVWVLGRRRPVLVQLRADRLVPVRRVRVGPLSLRMDVQDGRVWVTNNRDDSVSRVDARTGAVVQAEVPSRPYGIDARPDGIWVACARDHSVVRIDPRRLREVGEPVPVGLKPVSVRVAGRSVWVTGSADGTLTMLRY